MIKNAARLIIVFGCFSLNNLVLAKELKDFDKFWAVLTKLESNNDPKAVGDGGKAIGIAQIHKIYFTDAQKYDKTLINNTYLDCFRPEIAKKVVYAYLSKYSKSNDFEEWARLHNGGCNWKNKKDLTNSYWEKFKKISLALSK